MAATNESQAGRRAREIGAWLRARRDDAGLTQEELAEKCGLSADAIRSWELGRRVPQSESIERLLPALGVPDTRLEEHRHWMRGRQMPSGWKAWSREERSQWWPIARLQQYAREIDAVTRTRMALGLVALIVILGGALILRAIQSGSVPTEPTAAPAGGEITFGTQHPAPSLATTGIPTIPLINRWDPQHTDNCITVSLQGGKAEGFIYATHLPGTIPLRKFIEPNTGDCVAVAKPESQERLTKAGYTPQDAILGYIYETQLPGTTPLSLYFSEERPDYLVVATQEGEHDVKASKVKYVLLDTEGYVFSPDNRVSVGITGWRDVCAQDASVSYRLSESPAGTLSSQNHDTFYKVGTMGPYSYGYARGMQYQGMGLILTETLCQ